MERHGTANPRLSGSNPLAASSAQGWLAQLGERMLDVHEATGSSPVPPTKSGFPKTKKTRATFHKRARYSLGTRTRRRAG